MFQNLWLAHGIIAPNLRLEPAGCERSPHRHGVSEMTGSPFSERAHYWSSGAVLSHLAESTIIPPAQMPSVDRTRRTALRGERRQSVHELPMAIRVPERTRRLTTRKPAVQGRIADRLLRHKFR